ncbi:DUF3306 domain-containing protein [Acidovorax sp. DW039]|uniref:DUF3306 domain-containing protein n=1 Tax=Acidovorax sp. DW039 TaxID=3095606 RepID=UPI0030933285|nr:DUF3306 domain-containing protein [Acidovorax sp. DW039]
MAEGFLGRWSRRKQDVREGKPVQEPERQAVVEPPQPATAPAAGPALAKAPVQGTTTAPAADAVAAPPPPTLEDVQALSRDSDFKPFVGRAVAPEVRNAAMKKLFSDPHFNVMDGLDIYIDDYTQPDPLPASMLRQMVSAQFMGLVQDDKLAEPVPSTQGAPASGQQVQPGEALAKDPVSPTLPDGHLAQPGQAVAQSGVCTAIPSSQGAVSTGSVTDTGGAASASHPEHDHAHLRLQPDDAAERPGPGQGAS